MTDHARPPDEPTTTQVSRPPSPDDTEATHHSTTICTRAFVRRHRSVIMFLARTVAMMLVVIIVLLIIFIPIVRANVGPLTMRTQIDNILAAAEDGTLHADTSLMDARVQFGKPSGIISSDRFGDSMIRVYTDGHRTLYEYMEFETGHVFALRLVDHSVGGIGGTDHWYWCDMDRFEKYVFARRP